VSQAVAGVTGTEPHQSGDSSPRTRRERVRAQTVDEIKAIARRHLAADGSAALSLRAVARELGVVSSAVYRYFPSRDELLTALIVDAYDESGAVVEIADATCARDDIAGRFRAVSLALRGWAAANPSAYALLYGSPVPGYHAPAEQTVAPALRTTGALLAILGDAHRLGVVAIDEAVLAPTLSSGLGVELTAVARQLALPIPAWLLARGLTAWAHVVGAITLDLFGHLQNVVADRAALFDHELEIVARQVIGLLPAP
jgi:AcrR family transcriptional regulator